MVLSLDTYAGIGSRETPGPILNLFSSFAYVAADHGYLLRSGGARGADQAFEAGTMLRGIKPEIYLPWFGYEGYTSVTLPYPTETALEVAARYHPVWESLSDGAKKLHARNCHIVLGSELDDPVDFVVCWTPNGSLTGEGKTGGTGQALRIAHDLGIEIKNAAREEHLRELREITN